MENLNQHFFYPNLGPFQKSSWLNFERSNMDYQVTVDIIWVNRKKASVAIGFFHEQSRPDRDQFVTVLLKNVKPGEENLFSVHF